MASCPWRLAWRNPLGSEDIHVDCLQDAHVPAAQEHQGRLRESTVRWQQGDRRGYEGAFPGYEGAFPGWCTATEGCVLPAAHEGNCAT